MGKPAPPTVHTPITVLILETSQQSPKEQALRWYLLCALSHAHTHIANTTHANLIMYAAPGYTQGQSGHDQRGSAPVQAPKALAAV